MITLLQCQQCASFLKPENASSHGSTCRKRKSSCKYPDNSCAKEDMTAIVFPDVKVLLKKITPPAGVATFSSLSQRTPRQSSLIARNKLRAICQQALENKQDGHGNDPDHHLEPESFDDHDSDDFVLEEVASPPRKKRKKNATFDLRKRIFRTEEIVVHKCTNCPGIFRSKHRLEFHLKNVHEDASHQADIYTCPLCGRMMWTRPTFQHHLLDHTDAEAVEEELDLWNRKWPTSTTISVKFTCKFCLLPFTTKNSFITHMKTLHAELLKCPTWNCPHCEENFAGMSLLTEHLKHSHREAFFGSSKNLVEGRRGKCEKCGIILSRSHLKVHQSQGKCERKSLPDPNDNRHMCPLKECKLKLKTLINLKQHFVLHLKNNPYVCKLDGCGVRFSNQYHLDRHMRIHTGEMHVICPKCGLWYSREQKLALHKCGLGKAKARHYEDGSVRSQFAGLRLKRVTKEDVSKGQSSKVRKRINMNLLIATDPVFLEVCRENPEFKDHLLGPGPVKLKGRNWRCLKCQNVFTVQKSLHKHKERCDGNITNLVQYGCRICGDYFDTNVDLESHLGQVHRLQTLFKCKKCCQSFYSQKGLNRHLSAEHFDIKCSYCREKFENERKLNEHMTRHVPESLRTTCSKCDKKLSCATSFRRHMLQQHHVEIPKIKKQRRKISRNSQLPAMKRAKGLPVNLSPNGCNYPTHNLIKVEPELIIPEETLIPPVNKNEVLMKVEGLV